MPLKSGSILIKQKALSLGFSACGITPVSKLQEEEHRFSHYLQSNYNGEMEYLANHFDKRLDPSLLVEGARSIIVVLMNYFPSDLQSDSSAPVISKYAYGKDYHPVVKDKLHQLFSFIDQEVSAVKGRVFVDSAPILERAWAVQAGVGWIGKNGLLINKQSGSFFFIGELIIDLELDYDEPSTKEYCGTCTRCIDACPLQALVEPSVLDARRCISYLTIELKGDTPEEFKSFMKNRIFGCDICQDVCPWNNHPTPHSIPEFIPDPQFLKMDSDDWENLSEDNFNLLFHNTPLQRAGYSKLMKNIQNISHGSNPD
jgi:epoxyqueuosine reductase